MTLKNTERSYGTVAKWFHWTTALLFLGAYVSVYYRQWFTEDKTEVNWTALQMHLSIGVTLAVMVALRIIWRSLNKQPHPEPGTKLEHRMAKWGHYALYAVMIIMPATGYLGTGVNTEYFFLFDIPKFEETTVFSMLIANDLVFEFTDIEKPLDFIHKDIGGVWLVWILILGHTLAALYHHFVKKDRTFVRMTTGQ